MSACPLFSSSFTKYLALSQLLKRGLSKLINSSPRLTPKTGVVAALCKFLLRSPELGPRLRPSHESRRLLCSGIWAVVARTQEGLPPACAVRLCYASAAACFGRTDGRFTERVAGNPERLLICTVLKSDVGRFILPLPFTVIFPLELEFHSWMASPAVSSGVERITIT